MDKDRKDDWLIRYLVDKYGATRLIAILYSYEASSASPISPSTPESVGMNHTPRSIESISRPISSISTASSATGSVFSEVSSDSASFYNAPFTCSAPTHGTRSDGHPMRTISRIQGPTCETYPPTSPGPKQAAFHCPFCDEYGISTSISRKSDLKRHFIQFHNTNAHWTCPLRGCHMVFDWQSAYLGHLKEAHQGVHLPADDAMTQTCPQVVFACGFVNCKQIFEAKGDEEATKIAGEYFKHVANHFDDGATCKEWSHTARFRNLMRQRPVDDAWKTRARNPGSQDRPKWQPQTSFLVRKILETGHITDEILPLLVHWAAILGSAHYSNLQCARPKLPSTLVMPCVDSCGVVVAGHKASRRPDTSQTAETRNSLPGNESMAHKTLAKRSAPLTPLHAEPVTQIQTSLSNAAFQNRLSPTAELTSTAAFRPTAVHMAPLPPPPSQLPLPPPAMPSVYHDQPLSGTNTLSLSNPVHPLVYYYTGFNATNDLPSPQIVLDDLDKRIQAKMPNSESDTFHGQMHPQFIDTDGFAALQSNTDLHADAEMADYPPPQSTFYMS